MMCSFFVPPDSVHGRKLLTLRILAANENAPLTAPIQPQPRGHGTDARRPAAERARIQDICERIGASRLDVLAHGAGGRRAAWGQPTAMRG